MVSTLLSITFIAPNKINTRQSGQCRKQEHTIWIASLPYQSRLWSGPSTCHLVLSRCCHLMSISLYSGKSKEELIREKIMESEMRVAAQMGLSNPGTMTSGFTGYLNSTLMPNYSPRYHPLNISPNKFSKTTEAFGGMSLLGSLGFTSPGREQRLNNTLSPNNSYGEEDSHQS